MAILGQLAIKVYKVKYMTHSNDNVDDDTDESGNYMSGGNVIRYV